MPRKRLRFLRLKSNNGKGFKLQMFVLCTEQVRISFFFFFFVEKGGAEWWWICVGSVIKSVVMLLSGISAIGLERGGTAWIKWAFCR